MQKMISLFLIGICTIILSWCSINWSKNPEKINWAEPIKSLEEKQYISIFALWDSLTAWYQLPSKDSWPSQLESILQANWYNNYKIINWGKSGDTSQQLKDRLSWSTAEAKSGDIAIITIWWNDWFQWVPVKNLEDNLYEIIIQLQQKWVITIIGWMQITTNLWETYTSSFASIYPRIAQKTNSKLIPFLLEWVATDPSLNLPDMIHPNKEGYTIIANTIYTFLWQQGILSPK